MDGDVEVGYLNFPLANGGAVVPVGGGDQDAAALAVLAAALPGRRVVGVPAPTPAFGGGGVHRITQQPPRAVGRRGRPAVRTGAPRRRRAADGIRGYRVRGGRAPGRWRAVRPPPGTRPPLVRRLR
ncbi:agmatine deiminase family protein [Streptomyces sp. YGL11-2]|uniref:agmatine deiminase family protein n=1 Tax=Streptomyces sp. YGL11-2 TaxID=3414028 RepID=UPI003CECE75C